jgi:RNA polymerase sigma-70 factor (ECF subfamily)
MPEHEPGQQPADRVLSGAHGLDDATVEFEGFYRCTAMPLIRFLMLQGASPADAAEAAQDALTAACTHWHEIDSPKAWVHRVASRAWIRKVVNLREDLTAEPTVPTPLLKAIPTDAWHLRQELVAGLSALPPRQRQVMAWTLSGYSPAEIATELDLPNEQIRANLHLARRALAGTLNDGKETP